MIIKPLKVLLSDMILCLAKVMEWVNPVIVGHQMRVAYIASSIATEIGLPTEQQNELVLAGVLHDIGAFSLQEDFNQDDYEANRDNHADMGYLLLRDFRPFRRVAQIIRHHHKSWDYGTGQGELDAETMRLSQIIYLSGVIDSLIRKDSEIIGQVPDICRRMEAESGRLFDPEYVKAFQSLAKKEYFWFNLDAPSVIDAVVTGLRFVNVELDVDNIINLSKVFSNLIDFSCHYTASHSSGVAGTAEALAKLYSFSESSSQMMKAAGYLHDIGKLTIPKSILHKPTQLTEEEFNIVKKHPFWTYRALSKIGGLEEVCTWASFHHERIDSKGYPFRYEGCELPLGARIIAVADVFTALTEDRPYRSGMTRLHVCRILREMVADRALDAGVVSTLLNNIDQVDEYRLSCQAESARIYARLYDHAESPALRFGNVP